MVINLQFFGGRGGKSGFSNNSVIDKNAKTRTIETVFREARGYQNSYYKDEVLEAVDTGNGEVHFQYATPESREKTAKTNRTQYVTFKLKAGAENGDIFGVNWDNVKSVSGQTFNLKSEIKDKGFKWDGEKKMWVKK